MDSWKLLYENFDPEKEKLREALSTLGNGYFATRGSSSQSEADDLHYPGTYLACGYNRLKTEINGRKIENEDLVNLPNWLLTAFRILEGEWFHIQKVEIVNYRQELDMERGVLLRDITFRDYHGNETNMTEQRIVSMADPHIAVLELKIKPLNWAGTLEVMSAIDGTVTNRGVERYKKLNGQHLDPQGTEEIEDKGLFLKTRTVQSDTRIAMAADHRIYLDEIPVRSNGETILKKDFAGRIFRLDLSDETEFRMVKTVALYTSRDSAISECGFAAKKAISRAASFEKLMEEHVMAWKHLWRRFDMEFKLKDIKHDGDVALILHMNIFHLLQTISAHSMDMDVGVPSRGWHGEAYRGHIFWDELFIFPFLNMRMPEITRSLLMYRYRRLDEARFAAAEAGFKGAMYPWQSGSDGKEESQKLHLNPKSGNWIPDNSRLQRHVNVAIAYNVWKYYEVTNDMEFLSFYGAEIVLEIARFWASIAEYNEESGRYEIRGVMGPDEYHEAYPDAKEPGLSNNAYTNVMAVWVLKKAFEIIDILPEDRSNELCEAINLEQDEIERWNDIRKKMKIPFHDEKIISQFDGYEDLKEFKWKDYKEKYDDIQRLDRILEAEDDSTNSYKVSKQADVLMLFYLFSTEELGSIFNDLGYSLEPDMVPENIRYYTDRTSHGSSLSRVVHSWVLVRSERSKSWDLFKEALKIDFSDIQGGTTPEGIHLGAMSGSVNIMQEAYTGMESRDNVLWFNPRLPEELDRITMDVRYRGHTLKVETRPEILTVTSLRCSEAPINIGFNNEVFKLEGRDTITFTV